MIAEKAADMIRGRKLAPFEPPTRNAAHLYRDLMAVHPTGPVMYRPQAPPPAAPPPMAMYAGAHPPPMGQIYPDQLERSFSDLNALSNNSLASAANDLIQRRLQHDQQARRSLAANLMEQISPALR
jgi:hypothetical protein